MLCKVGTLHEVKSELLLLSLVNVLNCYIFQIHSSFKITVLALRQS